MGEEDSLLDALEKVELTARELLELFLTERQKEDLRDKGHFNEPAPSGGFYRICAYGSRLLQYWNEAGLFWAWWCVESATTEWIPRSDLLLSILFHLRHEPDRLFATGNVRHTW